MNSAALGLTALISFLSLVTMFGILYLGLNVLDWFNSRTTQSRS